MNKLANFIINKKKLIIIISIIWTIVFSIFLLFTKVDPDIQNMLPYNMKSRVDLRNMEKDFGGKEIAIILIENDKAIVSSKLIKLLKKYNNKLKKIDGIDSVNSLGNIPLKSFNKENIKKNKLIYGSLISKDFKILSIIINLSSSVKDEKKLTENIRNTFADSPKNLKFYFGGMPFLREQISKDIPSDMGMFIGIGIVIMLIFLKLTLKENRGVILPTLVVGIAIITSLGSIYLLGWKFQLITLILPVILIAVANDYGIHFISKYQEFNSQNDSNNKEIIIKTINSLGAPIIIAGITTIFGLLSLLSHIMIPARQMAILGAIGVFTAIMMSLLLIPAIILYLPKPKPLKNIINKKNKNLLNKTGNFVTKHPIFILLTFIITTSIMSMGIFKIDVDTNPVNYYPKTSELYKVSNIINLEFGGSQIINIVTKGDIYNKKNIEKIEYLEKKVSKNKFVGKVISIVDLLKGISQFIYPKNSDKYNKIPKTDESIKQLLDTYMLLSKDTSSFISKDRKKSLITVFVNNEGNQAVKSVLKDIKKETSKDKLFNKITGAAIIFSQLIDEVVKGQLISLIASLIIIFVLMIILFKSFIAGIISIIPLFISIILLFGIMGFTGIKLDISTTMLSSIVIGVGIDYTIHFLWKYRELIRKKTDYKEAIIITLTTTGRGIFFNAMSVVVGFSVLLFSAFMPVRFFGFLIILSILTALIASFTLLPAILLIIKPKFLE